MVLIDTRHSGHHGLIDTALCYIPRGERKTLDAVKVITMHNRLGYCLKARVDAKLVVINDAVLDAILLVKHLSNDNPFYRWAIYTVLHELAHAFHGHSDGSDGNEKEAQDTAIRWYNSYAPSRYGLPEMSYPEIEITKQEVLKLLGWAQDEVDSL